LGDFELEAPQFLNINANGADTLNDMRFTVHENEDLKKTGSEFKPT